MTNSINCETHGEGEETFVCSHLVTSATGLGFNCGEATEDKPYPDAWCDDCQLIYQSQNAWNEKNEGLISIRLLCSECYKNARIKHTRTDVALSDLDSLRWKCESCEEWHTGPVLDLAFDSPYYWHNNSHISEGLLDVANLPAFFLNTDVCIIESDYFVRGVIHLPIVGTAETFRLGVWGSLSKQNFEHFIESYNDPKRVELPSMFSWLSNDN